MSEVLQDKRILVIDDEQAMLEIVKSLLKRADAVPEGANTIQKGLVAANSGNVDAVILDRYMPDGDGHEVLKKLKSQEKTANIPVIMLTGEKNMDEIRASLKLGAVGYIVKPFTPKDFLSQLSKILDKNDKVQLDV